VAGAAGAERPGALHHGSVRGASFRSAVVVLALALTATGCSSGGLTDAERSRATTLPTPSTAGADGLRAFHHRLATLLASRDVLVDEHLMVDGDQTEVRLTWGDNGAVVDASMLPIGRPGTGREVFGSPTRLLSRATGDGPRCWAPAGPALSRFDRPAVQELAVLRSARADAGSGSLVTGSLSARSVLGIVGSDAQLRRRSLLPPAGVQVAASFGTAQGGLHVTVQWSDLVTAAGNSSRHTREGTWTLWFRPVGTGGPVAPPADQVVSTARNAPGFASQLRACNARIR
jgi:hypothetical protein